MTPPRTRALASLVSLAAACGHGARGPHDAGDGSAGAFAGIQPDPARPWRGVVFLDEQFPGAPVAWRVDGVTQAMSPDLFGGIALDTRALADGAHTVEVDTDDGTTHAVTATTANGPARAPAFTGAFVDVTDAIGIDALGPTIAASAASSQTGGSVAADFDGDGDQDLFAWTIQHGQLLLQTSPWVFTPTGMTVDGVNAAGAGDLDGDGDPDLVTAGATVHVFRNDGGALVDVTAASGAPVVSNALYTGVAMADLDSDGLLDVALAQMNCNGGAPNAVLRNEGGLRFADVADTLGMRSPTGATFAFAFDRVPGVTGLVARVFREGCTSVHGLRARMVDGDDLPALVDVEDDNSSPMGSAYFDGDGDGALDVWLSGNFSSWLFVGPGFRDDGSPFVGLQSFLGLSVSPVTAWSMVLLDADMDGLGDVFVVHDWLFPYDVPTHALYWHRSRSTMDEIASAAGFSGEHGCRAAQGADLDGDGDTDLLLGCVTDGPRVFRNDLVAPGVGRTLYLHGAVSNADGVHAVVTTPRGEVRLSRGSGQPYEGGVVHESLRADDGTILVDWPSGIQQRVPVGSAGALAVNEPAGLGLSARRVLPGARVDVWVDPSAWGRAGATVTVNASAGSWANTPTRGDDGVYRGTLAAPDAAGATVVLQVTLGDYVVPIRPRVFVRAD